MRAFVCAALLAGLQGVVGGLAYARPGEPTPARSDAVDGRKGALIIALGETAPEAWALARSVYAEPALRPPVSDATARALVGEPTDDLSPEPGETERVEELAELRGSMEGAPDDPDNRRLLWSIGRESNAAAVVVVSASDETPPRVTARVLDVETGSYSAAVFSHDAEEGWTGAALALRSLVTPRPPPPAPIVPTDSASKSGASVLPAGGVATTEGEGDPRSWYESPWFWGSTGAVAAVGVTVLVLAVATQGDTGSVRLQGRAPQ